MPGNTVDIRVIAHDMASRTMANVGKGLGGISKGLLGIGAAGNAVGVLGGVAAAGAQLLPIALALPAALGAGAFAMATFKTATAGFGEALNAKDPAAFAEATKDMAPAMRETASAVRELKDGPLKELKRDVQGQFWDGFSGEVRKLGGTYIPVLQERMGNIANGMNLMGKNLSNALQSKLVVGAVKKIGDNTANMFYNMSGAAGNFASGLIKLGGVGSSYLPKVGTQIEKLGEKWNNWVNKGSADGSIKRMIDGAIAGFKDLGAIVVNIGLIVGSVFRGIAGDAGSPLAALKQLTGQVADFMTGVSAQEALRSFGDMLRTVSDVVGKVFMATLKQLAPIVRDLAPVVGEVAEALGTVLLGAIEVVGPILQDLARWMGENKEMLGDWAAAALVAWAAFKGYTVLSGLAIAIRGVVTAAGGLAPVAGLLARIAGVVGIGLIAKQLDDYNMAVSGGDPAKLGFMADQLHEFVGMFEQLATNPASVLQEIGSEFDELTMKWKTGNSELGKFQAWLTRIQTGFKLEPVNFRIETGPAEQQVNAFMKTVSTITPTVNINGNTNEAGFALRTILTEIAAGKESVTIDGKPMKAQEALTMVIQMINNSAGDVTMNGNTMPAGQALAEMLNLVIGSRADLSVGANTGGANSSLQGLVNTWQGYTIRLNAVVSSRVGGLAKGGVGGGMTWVGERGPELVRTMAGGGNRGRGRTLVGERGPELVSLPPGSQVTPTGKTQAMLAQSGSGGGGGAVQVSFAGGLDSAFATYFMKLVREGKITVRAAS